MSVGKNTDALSKSTALVFSIEGVHAYNNNFSPFLTDKILEVHK